MKHREVEPVRLKVEAVQWDGHADTANAFIGESYGEDWAYVSRGEAAITIPFLFGRIEVGDWLVKNEYGKVFDCKPEQFARLYERS